MRSTRIRAVFTALMFAFEHCATAAGNTVRQASDTPASLVIAKDDLGIPVFAADARLA